MSTVHKIFVTEEQFKQFQKLLDRPPEVKPKLRKLLSKPTTLKLKKLGSPESAAL